MKRLSLIRMNQRGVLLHVLPILFVFIFVVIGVGFLVYTHAATAATYEVSNGNNVCVGDSGNQGQSGVALTATACNQSSRQIFQAVGTGDTTHWHTYKVYYSSNTPECIGGGTTSGTKLQAVGCSSAISLYVNSCKQLEVANSGKGSCSGVCVGSVSGSVTLSSCTSSGDWSPIQENVASTGGGGTSGSGGGGSTATGQCAKGGSYLWNNLAKCGWPAASNTGPVLSQCPGGKLTTVSGSLSHAINITKAGTTVSCENITGMIYVDAPNVTIKNIDIESNSGKTGEAANGTADIFISDGASATVENANINGDDGVHACVWDQGTKEIVDAVNCYGVDDGIWSWADTSYSKTTGDNFTVENSYFHDFTTKTSNGHEDGYQTEGAADGTISHNTYELTSGADSDVAIWDSLKSSSNITVKGNLMTGGGFAVYAEDYNPSQANPVGGFTTTKINFDNNDFSTHASACVGQYGVWFTVANAYKGGPTDGWHRSGNVVLETGENIDSSNPHNKGALCD